MQHLQSCLAWRVVPRQYRQRRKDGLQTAHLVREVGEKIAQAFEPFKQDWKIARNPLPEEALYAIIQEGLQARKGGNPRHKIACGLLATLPWWNVQGEAIKLTPSLVESTLETLRKRDIRQEEPPTKEPASSSSRTFCRIDPPLA
jgi:hypothetical protein